jgi:hypothetical protein
MRDGGMDVICVMRTPEQRQLGVDKTLRAEAHPVRPTGSQRLCRFGSETARIRLYGYFRIGIQIEPLSKRLKKPLNLARGKDGWRTAADIEGSDAGSFFGCGFRFFGEGVKVGRNAVVDLYGGEIAIAALGSTIWYMYVKRSHRSISPLLVLI